MVIRPASSVLPPKRPVSASQADGGRGSTPPPPLARKIGEPKGDLRATRNNDNDAPNLLPQPVDLLSSDEEMQIKGWEALKPS
jgi:hypothetical protein